MKKILFPLGLALAIVGCAPGEPAKTADFPSDVHGGPGLRPTKVCFEGRQNQKSCWNLVQRSEIPTSQADLYEYQNPYTDPSFPPSFSKAQYLPPDRLVDIRQMPHDTGLSENFDRSEFLREGSNRGNYGVLSPAALGKIQNMRTATGKMLTINSGYRSPGYNSKVDGSALWSRHTYGDAIDFTIAGLNLKKAADECRKQGAAFTQVYTTHVHCDWRNLSLDPSMYPVGAVNMQPSRFEIRSEELGRIVARVMQTESELDVQTLVLETQVLMKEDEGELLHEWEVISPSGEYSAHEGPTLSLPKVSGTYLVRVQVGGSLNFERNITIP